MNRSLKIMVIASALGTPWIAAATTTSFTGVNTYNLIGTAASISGSATGITGSGTGNTTGSWTGNGAETVNVSRANQINAVLDIPLVTNPDQYADVWTLSVPTGELANITFTPTNFPNATAFKVNNANVFTFSGLGAGTYTYNLSGTAGLLNTAKYVVNTTVSAVPLPAAVWLLGSAMLGLLGFTKRKHGSIA